MKLNLCCGQFPLEGYLGVDIIPRECVDVVADLDEFWPWQDGTIDEVFCKDGFEHLKDTVHTMNELYRVLKPGGLARIVVPSTDGRGAFQDPTHRTFWNINTFRYFEEGHGWRAQYPHISAKFEILRLEHTHGTHRILWVLAELRKPNG
jgi:SAM-dependent methyltransferase